MKRVFNLLFIINAVILILFDMYVSFSNPDITQIRLFLTYWKEYIVLVIYPLAWGIAKIFRS